MSCYSSADVRKLMEAATDKTAAGASTTPATDVQYSIEQDIQRVEKKYIRLGLRYHLLQADADAMVWNAQDQQSCKMAFTVTNYFPSIMSDFNEMRKQAIDDLNEQSQCRRGPTLLDRLNSVRRDLQSLQGAVRRHEAKVHDTCLGLDSPLQDSLNQLGWKTVPYGMGIGRWFHESEVLSQWVRSLPLVKDWLQQGAVRDYDQAFVQMLRYADVGAEDDEELSEESGGPEPGVSGSDREEVGIKGVVASFELPMRGK
jgi:hypothetical protein